MAETYDGTEGNDALAAGYDVMDGGEDWRNGWRAINRTRDLVARALAAISWSSLTGKPSSFPNADVTAADASATEGRLVRYGSAGRINVSTPTTGGNAANKSYVDDAVAGASGVDSTARARASAAQDDADDALNGELNAAVYSRTLSGYYRNLYVNTSGTIGWVSSSARFKQDIAEWAPDRQAIIAAQLVQFRYIADGDDGPIQHGLIAEQLDGLGLEWLVEYDEDGAPFGVRYDLLALGILALVQDHDARLTTLEERA